MSYDQWLEAPYQRRAAEEHLRGQWATLPATADAYHDWCLDAGLPDESIPDFDEWCDSIWGDEAYERWRGRG